MRICQDTDNTAADGLNEWHHRLRGVSPERSLYLSRCGLRAHLYRMASKIDAGAVVVILYEQVEWSLVPVGYVELMPRTILIDDWGTPFEAYTPHSYIKEHLRGKGVVSNLYRALNKAYMLICDSGHSEDANRLWRKLCETEPRIFVKVCAEDGAIIHRSLPEQKEFPEGFTGCHGVTVILPSSDTEIPAFNPAYQ